MLHGQLPFGDTEGNQFRIFWNILHNNMAPFSADLTQKARALVRGLLHTDEATRLGRDLLNHAWFATFKAEEAVNLTLRPPWRPRLRHADDMKFPLVTRRDQEEVIAAAFASPELINTYEHVWATFRS